MYLVYSFVSFVVVFLVKWMVEQWRFYGKLKNIPGPKPLPFLGNVLDFLSPTDVLPNVLRFMKEFGKSFKVYMGPIYTYIIVADPELIEHVLSSNKLIEKSHDYHFLKPWLGDGLITAPGFIWRKFRKALTPAFHFKILERMVDNFAHSSKVLIEKLNKEVASGTKQTDIYPFVTLYSLDVICETAMGISIHAQEREDPFVSSTRQMLQIVNGRIFSICKQFDFLYHLSSDYQKQLKALKILHHTSGSVIKTRKIDYNNKTLSEDERETDEFGIKKRRAFLDLMLEMKVDGIPISDESIRNNVDTIMFAGHDTTASSISFCLHSLSRYPDVQQKLFDEIISITGTDPDRIPNYNELNEMKYLDLVAKETLRIYPSVHLIGRKVYEDFEFNGVCYPKGVTLALSPYLVHRNEDYFPDPEHFDPERFTVDNCAKRHPYSYIPFSAGPRNCIGQKFAILSMKSAVAVIVKNFELLPVPERKLILSAEVVMKAADGIYVSLKKRK